MKKFLFISVLAIVISMMVLQVASYFFLKPILEREARRIFEIPIYIDQAGANLFRGSFWVKGVRIKNSEGFSGRDIFTARTIAFDLSIASLLTHEFSVQRILFKDPELKLEINELGEFNGVHFFNRLFEQFDEWLNRRNKLINLIEKYMLEKFSIRNGTIQFIDKSLPDRKVTLNAISFNLARLVYPPDPKDPLPIALYLNATLEGETDGQILLLGKSNMLSSKKSFDLTGSIKNLSVKQYKSFISNSPLPMTDGLFQFKIKALCEDNKVDIYHQVRLDNLRFEAELPKTKASKMFGIEPESIVRFFNNKTSADTFEFDFRVTGDLKDPAFNLFSLTSEKMQQAIHDRLELQMKSVEERAVRIAGIQPIRPAKIVAG